MFTKITSCITSNTNSGTKDRVKLTNSMHEGYQTDVLIMDFSKAIDKVSHRDLVSKLRSYVFVGEPASGSNVS